MKMRMLPASLGRSLVALPTLLLGSLALHAQEEESPGWPAPDLTLDPSPLGEFADGQRVSYAGMLEEATPSVVGVVTRQVIEPGESGPPQSLEEMLRRFYGMPDNGNGENGNGPDFERRIPGGMGSGVIVSPQGYILTNNHVVRFRNSDEVADEILVQLSDGREIEARLVGADEKTDIAVLKVDVDEPLSALPLGNSDDLRVGDVCFAIGNPLRVGLTVTKGIVSATGRTDLGILGMQGYEDFIQTDASINMGNSGGPLVDAKGRLIGINTAILSRTGGNIGIGFAIPVNLAVYVMENLIEFGTVPRGFLGVVPGNLTPDLAEAFGLDSIEGALVRQVEPGSAAARAGIEHGDVILSVDDRAIGSAQELRLAIAQTPPGETVDLIIVRDGEEMTKEVVLGDLTAAINGAGGSTDRADTAAGLVDALELEPLSERNRSSFSVPAQIEGLLITEVNSSSRFSQYFQPGAVISEINGTAVRSVDDLESALQTGQNLFYVWFDGVYNFVSIPLE